MGRSLLKDYRWEGNGQLAEAIRTGKRPIAYSATTIEAIDIWIGAYSRSWTAPETYLKNCVAMWQALGIHGHDGLRILDLACGPAPKSLALALANPGVRVTLVDWERVLEVARKVAADLGVDNQVTSFSGNLTRAVYGRNQCDVAFLGDVTHFFSPEQNIRVFRKAYDALVDGGTLVVVRLEANTLIQRSTGCGTMPSRRGEHTTFKSTKICSSVLVSRILLIRTLRT